METFRKYSALKSVVERCDAVVRDTLKGNRLREADIALEGFNNGGKRLRPALLVLSSMVPNGGEPDEADDSLINLAGAVELIHLATLFHDDVIDEVDTRRTKLSARLKYGSYISVLTGDYALAEALDLVVRSGHPAAMPEFVRTLRVLVRGESVETVNQYNYDLTEAQYYEIISEKSASLFALSCKIGAMTRGAEFADTLGHFGWSLGMAFQMIDDLDDMLDSPNHSYDCDLRNGYISLPLIGVFQNLQDGHRDRLVRVIEQADFNTETERYIVSLCMEYGTIQQTKEDIHDHLERARKSLDGFDDSKARRLLLQVLDDLEAYADRQAGNFARFLREDTAMGDTFSAR